MSFSRGSLGSEGEENLRAAIRRFHKARRESHVDLAPPSVYCLLTRESVDDLEREFGEIKKTLRGIWVSVFLVLVGLIIDILLLRTGVLGGL